jgi:hypothetical protein
LVCLLDVVVKSRANVLGKDGHVEVVDFVWIWYLGWDIWSVTFWWCL